MLHRWRCIEHEQKPHYHVIYWVQIAPTLDVDSNEAVCRFINEYITTIVSGDDEDLYSLVKMLQNHQCSAYCHRKDSKCCFGFQKVPSLQTLISQLPSDDIPNHKELIWITKEILRKLSEEMKEHPNQTINELLEMLMISAEYYVKYLKMSSTAPKIILLHETNTCYTDPYNATILSMWKANMDIWFIENAVSAVMYATTWWKQRKGWENYWNGSARRSMK